LTLKSICHGNKGSAPIISITASSENETSLFADECQPGFDSVCRGYIYIIGIGVYPAIYDYLADPTFEPCTPMAWRCLRRDDWIFIVAAGI